MGARLHSVRVDLDLHHPDRCPLRTSQAPRRDAGGAAYCGSARGRTVTRPARGTAERSGQALNHVPRELRRAATRLHVRRSRGTPNRSPHAVHRVRRTRTSATTILHVRRAPAQTSAADPARARAPPPVHAAPARPALRRRRSADPARAAKSPHAQPFTARGAPRATNPNQCSQDPRTCSGARHTPLPKTPHVQRGRTHTAAADTARATTFTARHAQRRDVPPTPARPRTRRRSRGCPARCGRH